MHFQFALRQLLWLLMLLPLFYLAYSIAHRIFVQKLSRLAGMSPLNKHIVASKFAMFNKRMLCSLGLGLLLIALARPQFDYVEIPTQSTGREIMILFDLSTSMLATDQAPNRLEVAKREVSDMLEVLEGDRVGIIGFAGSAFVQCPMTSDYSMIKVFLSQFDPHQISWQGTAIADAITLGERHLLRGAKQAQNDKMMILITDGEDQHQTAAKAASTAKKAGIPVHVLAIGTEEGSPIPDKNGKFKTDRQGNLILSKMGKTSLTNIANKTNGIFTEVRPGAETLVKLYKAGVNQLTAHEDKQELSTKSDKIWFERFQYPLTLAFILLMLEPFLSRFKKRREA